MSQFQPAGSHTVIPRIIVASPKELIAFLKEVFHAQGEYASGRPAEIKIGDSVVMISDGGGVRDIATAFLYVYVENTDATFARALTAGAIDLEKPSDMPYGDRRATVRDKWGNTWQIATHRVVIA
jgi:PhnB protein